MVKGFNRKNGCTYNSFPPIENEHIDYELGCSEKDNFYAMTDGMEGEYEDVYGIDYYDE